MNQIHTKNRLYMLPALLFCLGLQGTAPIDPDTIQSDTPQPNVEVSSDFDNYDTQQAFDTANLDPMRRPVPHHAKPSTSKPTMYPIMHTPQQATNQQFSPAMHKQGQSGTLDLSFGNGTGYVVDHIGKAYAVAVQPDGKILVGGSHARATGDEQNKFCIARYTIDGALDTSFGSGHKGYVTTDVGSDAFIKAIAIQENGKIVVGGSGVLARYLSDGHLDTQFGPDGNGIVPRSQTGMSDIISVAIQPDGKIVAIGSGWTIVQFNTNGSKNREFDITGAGLDALYDAKQLLVQTDGKIITAGLGQVKIYDRSDGDYSYYTIPVLMGHNPNGSLDTSFGGHNTGLSYFTGEESNYNNITSLVIIPSGHISIIAARYSLHEIIVFSSNGIAPDYAGSGAFIDDVKKMLYSYNNGTPVFLVAVGPHFVITKRSPTPLYLERNFGNNGITELKIPGKGDISITSISYAQNNKFIAVGFSHNNEFIVARYYN